MDSVAGEGFFPSIKRVILEPQKLEHVLGRAQRVFIGMQLSHSKGDRDPGYE
jgi:hypothetical protein